MIPFYSKRNQVYPCIHCGEAAVEKHFSDPADWQCERTLYAELEGKLSVPAVLAEREGVLVTRFEPHPTFLAELERQETEGFDELPWCELARWLERCHSVCGKVPTDGNLRNFLWDAGAKRVIGLDLESWGQISLSECGAMVIAAVLRYDPSSTPVKKQAAALLGDILDVPQEQILSAEQMLLQRRGSKMNREMSGVILAGGLSSRMGQQKALLTLEGKTLLEWQIGKLRALGISDIMVSGALEVPGVRVIADEYPQRGPLGGLHACLKAAKHSSCLVLSVDVPLIPVNTLANICRTHRTGATILRHAGGEEPLIAVYDSALHEIIEPIIRERGASVRVLQDKVGWSYFDYPGPEEFLHNCNTPEEFSHAEMLTRAYREKGVPL